MTIKKIMLMLAVFVGMAQVSSADVWQDMAKYEYGADPNPSLEIETILQDTAVKDYGKIEVKLIAIVSSPSATRASKDIACRFLQQVGSKRCIPARFSPITPDWFWRV